uniref:Uncharacterized protein n=1 Tax=Amphimedon queenslandica TaxID=400682 RepID=A0A1X7T2A2_AMPQE
MFPLVITHLLTHNKCPCKVDFPPLDPHQYYKYRDALSFWIFIKTKRYTLHIINHYSHIEVYFDESVQEAKVKCPYIRELVMKAVSDSAKAINLEQNHVAAFSCLNEKEKNCYCVIEEDHSINCTLCKKSADISGDSYWCWFDSMDCGTKIIASGMC